MQQMTTQPISITIISINPTFLPPIPQTHNLKPKPNPHFPNPTISAKWGKKRSRSQRTRKLIINSIAHIASTLKILPEPFDSLLREFWVMGGGNGGKFGFGKGFGFGGGGGSNNRRQKFGFWVVLMVSSSLALWVVLERERGGNSEVGFWVLLVLASAFTVYCMGKRGWRREMKDWVLGFSCGAALMGLGLRKNVDFVKWVDEFRGNYLSFFIIKQKRRGRRWV